jgi:hypothetical protein
MMPVIVLMVMVVTSQARRRRGRQRWRPTDATNNKNKSKNMLFSSPFVVDCFVGASCCGGCDDGTQMRDYAIAFPPSKLTTPKQKEQRGLFSLLKYALKD